VYRSGQKISEYFTNPSPPDAGGHFTDSGRLDWAGYDWSIRLHTIESDDEHALVRRAFAFIDDGDA
jgi:hypothetical protein